MSCPGVGRKQWFLQSFGSEQPSPKKTLSMTNGDVNLSGQGLACRLDNMATATGVETPLCLSYMAGNPAARNFVTFFPPESTHIAKQGAHGAMSFKDSIRCWKWNVVKRDRSISNSLSLHLPFGTCRACQLHVINVGCVARKSKCPLNMFKGRLMRSLAPSSHRSVQLTSKAPLSGRQSSNSTTWACGRSRRGYVPRAGAQKTLASPTHRPDNIIQKGTRKHQRETKITLDCVSIPLSPYRIAMRSWKRRMQSPSDHDPWNL